MNPAAMTWQGPSIDDTELLAELPAELRTLLRKANGFVLHHGALHVRGATHQPAWHSLRAIWQGGQALHGLYELVRSTDIPFAQDQLGDQFLLRDGAVLQLSAESGEIEEKAASLAEFLAQVEDDIEGYLNVGLEHQVAPGKLLLAFPPFVLAGPGKVSLKEISAAEVISLHANLARQLQTLPDGTPIEFKLVD